MSRDELQEVLKVMNNTKVLVIGDVMLDAYEHCNVERISPEAPVPVAVVKDVSYFLGGSGNVANNAKALGAEVSLIGVIGPDQDGQVIKKLLNENNIEHSGLILEQGRRSTVKRRVVSGTHQLMRIDTEMISDIMDETKKAIRDLISLRIEESDVVIISDYCKGLISDELIEFIKQESTRWNKKILVDSKNKNLLKYSGVYIVKPNKEEAERFAGESFTDTYSNLEEIGKNLVQIFKSNVVITLGRDGIALFENDYFIHKKTEALQVFDVSGAGDTVLATIAVAVAAKASIETSVHLSNIAAGYVVSRLGTTVCRNEFLKEMVDRIENI